MRSLYALTILLGISSVTVAQELNGNGHISFGNLRHEKPEVVVEQGLYKVKTGALTLNGNACFKTDKGYLTILSVYETLPSALRVYNSAGEELWQKEYPQILNLQVSADGRTAVFHDGKLLHTVDMETYSETTADASLIFAAGNNGKAAWYNTQTGLIHYQHQTFAIGGEPHQLLVYKERLLALTRQGIYVLENGMAQQVRSCRGTGIRMAVNDEVLYLVERNQRRSEKEFTLYQTTDLQEFRLLQSKPAATQKSVQEPSGTREQHQHRRLNNTTREPIQGPLNYTSPAEPYRIGNSYAEIQDYGGTPYMHPGIDVLGLPGQEVYSVKQGVVKAILTTSADIHWRVAVAYSTTDTLGYLYAHLDQLSIPFVPGDTVNAGQVLGNLVTWPIADFHHVHFARINNGSQNWTGNWWTIDNPLVDLTNHTDNTSPVFQNAIPGSRFAFRNSGGAYLPANNLSGSIEIISNVYDRCNTSNWNIDVYELRYALATQAAPTIKLLDTLAFRYDFPTDVYGTGNFSTLALNTVYSRDNTCFSIGNYDERKFYQLLSRSDGNGVMEAQDQLRTFNTAAYPDGWYYLSVTATDASLNTKTDSMLVYFNNGIVNAPPPANETELSVFPNPADGVVYLQAGPRASSMYGAEVFFSDVLGRLTKLSYTAEGNTIEAAVSGLPAGLYTVHVQMPDRVFKTKVMIK